MEMLTAAHRDEKYSWLDYGANGTEYLEPWYYDRILKPYLFPRRGSYLALLAAFLGRSHLRPTANVLEIGPGTGRATEILHERLRSPRVDLVDQSQRMIDHLRHRFHGVVDQALIKSDAIAYLARTSSKYDLVCSLWSLSHSIHQNISRNGMQHGRALATYALRRLFDSVVKPTGEFFIIHFDSTSEEQRISLRQRRHLEPWLTPGSPPPSQLLIEEVLCEKQREGVIQFDKRHLTGMPIVYSTLDDALEVFMNFHMEGVFNHSPRVDKVMADLVADLSSYQRPDGTLAIKPGCFIYSGHRSKPTVPHWV